MKQLFKTQNYHLEKQNKYRPYISQLPVVVNPNSRAEKRRQWRNNWKTYLTQDYIINFDRKVRRSIWKLGWKNDFMIKAKMIGEQG